jgi:TM2 domain-containing membrane protein YozV
MMRRTDKPTAYLLWAIGLLGFCGLQRFYLGQVLWGLVYLLTFGFFGIGQLLDLFLLPGLVEQRNAELKRLYWAKHGYDMGAPSDLATINREMSPLSEPSGETSTPLQQLLQAAHEQGGTLSEAQIVLHTGLSPDAAKSVLQEALHRGYADVANDPKTGAVRYIFDV